MSKHTFKITLQRRIFEKNKINDEIRILQKSIVSNQKHLDRLQNGSNTSFIPDNENNKNFYKTQQLKISTLISTQTQRLTELQQRFIDVDAGLLDASINEEYKKNKDESDKKGEKRKRDKKQENPVEPKNKKQENPVEPKNKKQTDNSDFKFNNNFVYKDTDSYEKYLNLLNTIPYWMKEKLRNMPGNKGYIWRGIACFGEAPVNKYQPTVLFENDGRTGNLFITEIKKDQVFKFIKYKSTGKQELISVRDIIK